MILALIGLGMLSAPRLTRRLLFVIGVRWPESEHRRIAAWLLVVLGLTVAVLGRVVT